MPELRAALEALVRMPSQQRAALGARARQRILDEFTLEARANKVRRIYDWVLERGPRPHLVPPLSALAHLGAA